MTEEEIQDKYDGKIQKEMSGKTYEVITDLFRGNPNYSCFTFGSFNLLYTNELGKIFL